MNLEGLAPFGFNPLYPDYAPHEMDMQMKSGLAISSETICYDEVNSDWDPIGDCQIAASSDLTDHNSMQKPFKEPAEESIEETIENEDITHIKDVTIQKLQQEIAHLKETCKVLQEQLQVFANIRTTATQLRTKHYDADDPIQIWSVQWRSGFTVPIDDIPKRGIERPPSKWYQDYRLPILSYFRSSS